MAGKVPVSTTAPGAGSAPAATWAATAEPRECPATATRPAGTSRSSRTCRRAARPSAYSPSSPGVPPLRPYPR